MTIDNGGLLGAAWHASPLPAIVLDGGMRVAAFNSAYTEMSGRTPDELRDAFSVEFVHADDLPGALAGFDRLLAGEPYVTQRRRHRRGDGTWCEVLAVSSMFRVGETDYLLVQFPEHRSVDVDQASELEARAALGPWGDALAFTDRDARVVIAPRLLVERLGCTLDWMRGRRLTDPELRPVTPDGIPLDPEDDPVLEALARGDEVVRTIGLHAADGTIAWYSVRAGCVEHESVAARATLRDVSELVQAQQEIRALAALVERELSHQIAHDDLTGLKTRKALIAEVEQALEAGEQIALVFVDLDGFKAINDQLGHLAGDDALVAVADALRELAPPEAVLGRAGGDEFVLLARSVAGAEGFAAAVRERTLNPEGLATVRGCRIGASVGVGVSKPGDTRSQLFARADRAMYEHKRDGLGDESREGRLRAVESA